MAADARTKRLTLIACVLGTAVVFLDGTVVNVALPAIRDDLDTGLAAQQWVVEAYLLTLGALLLVGGSLGDLLGRRRIFSVGLAGFGVTSVLCALAPNAELLVAARGAAGDRGRAARAVLAGDHHRGLPARGARRGDRDVDGVGRHRDGDRAARRRAARRPRVVALDLRHQRAVRAGDAGDPARGGPGVGRRGVHAPHRLPRRAARRARPRRAGVRADRAARLRLRRPARLPAGADRARAARPVRPPRAPLGPSDAAARAVPLAQLRGRQRRHAARLRRARRGDVLRRDLPPAGGGLLGGRGRADAAADHRDHVRALAALGRAVGPHRAAGADGRRADRGRARADLDGAPGHRRRLRDASCCPPCSCSGSGCR